MTEVLLVSPRVGSSDSTAPVHSADMMAMRETLGFLTVVSYLKSNGWRVKILDASLYPEDWIRAEV